MRLADKLSGGQSPLIASLMQPKTLAAADEDPRAIAASVPLRQNLPC